MNQPDFGAIGGVKKVAQINYEKGERHPDSTYLAALAAAGVDVRFVLTGKRPEEGPSADEQRLLALYRLADIKVRQAVLAALATGEWPVVAKASTASRVPAPAPKTIKHGGTTVTIHGDVGQQVKGGVHSPQTINMGGARGRKPKGS